MPSRLIAVVLVSLFGAIWPGFAQTSPPNLGSAASFAVLGRSVTNARSTIIAGNVGGTVTGDPLTFVIGDPHGNDALAQQAQKDNAAAYSNLDVRPCTPLSGSPHGTLTPGVYCASSDVTLTGTLQLNGNENGLWIFEIDGSLTTAACSLVETINGAKDSRVFWRIRDTATFGAKSTFVGNVLTRGDITLQNNASIAGRLLSQSGVVTLNDAGVTICCDVLTILEHTLPNGQPGKSYSATLNATGGTGTYTFAVVKGQLPPGLTFSGATVSGTPTTAGVYKFAIVLSDSAGLNCIRIYTITVCAEIEFLPIPNPIVCVFYEHRVTPPGVTTTTAGPLPPGLELSLDGVLRGTPKTPGHYTFPITATDAGCCSTTHVYDVDVGIDDLKVTPDKLPNGQAGIPYFVKLSIPGTTDAKFDLPAGLPPGLVLHPDGTLDGTPTVPGCYIVTVSSCFVTITYEIIICDVPVTFKPKPEDLTPATVCTLYCQKFTADGCTGPYTLSITGNLPPGFTLSNKGELCGTPTTASDYSFTITAIGARGCTATQTYNLTVTCPKIVIAPNLPDAKACTDYQHQFPQPTNCPYTYTADTLPADLHLTEKGFLSGVPKTPGDYTFNVTVTLDGCPPVVTPVHLKVGCNVTIDPPNLPLAILGAPYSKTLTASCGVPPYTFSLASGPLPPGLVGPSANGTISGTPIVAGCFQFTVHVESAISDCAADRTYVICVVPATTDVPSVSGWGMGVLLLLLLACALTMRLRI